MRMALCGTLAAFGLVLCGFDAASAQSQTVLSPVGVGTGDGSTANSFPWASGTVRRYMQVHSDIKGTPKVINKLAWRRDGAGTTSSTATRAVDLELYMGNSVEWSSASFVISNNYTAAPSLVLPRQVVNFGPLLAVGNPAPAEMAVPLSTPFVYAGVKSVAWEAVVYSNTATGSWPSIDVHQSTLASTPAITTSGAGCIRGGGTVAMSLVASHADTGGLYSIGAYILNAPVTAPTVLAIGTTNPNLPVTGLCGNLYTDLAAMIPVGLTDASGAIKNVSETSSYASPNMVFTAPNTFPGAQLFLQAHSIDAASTSLLPICNSNGLAVTVPAISNTRIVECTRIFNNVGGTTAAHGIYFNTSAYGHSIVTEFTY